MKTLDYYIETFKNIRPKIIDGQIKPHKICMLLAMLDLANSGGLKKNQIKSKPNINLYLTELNSAIVNDNKSSVFYTAEQKSLESKNIFKLEKENATLTNPFNLKN